MRLPKPIATGVRFQSRALGSVYTATQMKAYAALVAAAEREACAEICERRKSLYWMEFDKTGSDADKAAAIASEECSDAIRARGDA